MTNPCWESFCEKHRLPEDHYCPQLSKKGRKNETSKRHSIEQVVKSAHTQIEAMSDTLFTIISLILIASVIICVLSSLLNSSYIPDIFSHGYFQTNDIVRYYSANIGSFFDWIKSWGWYFVNLFPIPIIPLTTDYSLLVVVQSFAVVIGYYIIIKLFSRTNNKIVFLLTMVIIPVVVFGIIEQERRTLTDFQTREELLSFLHSDQVDKNTYSDVFTCEDFSRTLIRNAKSHGYLLYYHTTTDHALCEAYIKSENAWIFVEPQTDETYYDK